MRKALVIGINDYGEQSLSGCINDAIEVSTLLESNGDGSPNFDVVTKTEIKTKSELKGLIKGLFEGDSETDLFYFSGHGFFDNIGGYLVTPDYEKDDPGVSMDEILVLANNSKAQNKIIILDCCYSGAFGSPVVNANRFCQINEGVVILTASKKDEVSSEINGHGVFTYLFLEALKGGSSDLTGKITPGSIYSYIDKALGAWEQRPVFKTNVSNFVSLRQISPPITIDVLKKIIKYFPKAQDEFKLDPSYEWTEKCADPNHDLIFKDLQKMVSNGLVIPVDAEALYWAAINSKSCKLTSLGWHYWRLVEKKRI